MLLPFVAFGLLAASTSLVKAVELTGYEYVVVGSGAGGGPVAARLAMAGHKTLLIEAGDDHGQSVNYTVPAYSAKASEDSALSWDFFVHHYADDERQALDYKTTYETPDGTDYTGLDPPPGSTVKGTLYPRTGALGGCTAHNALVAIYPFESDFEYVASLTGDKSWAPDAMRKYFVNAERNNYLSLSPGHGYNGWLQTEQAPLSLVVEDTQLLSMITGGFWALGNWTRGVFNLATLAAGDANADSKARDQNPGYYQIPISSKDNARVGSREIVVEVRDAKNKDGSQKYPLDVRTNCYATKVLFDDSASPPRATGVEFLDGEYLFKASPRSGETHGTPGSVNASSEVILAGGVYNSPMLLKHSGVGPREELEKFGIPVVADLPGVGTNLQDHYEISVISNVPENFTLLNGCTFTSDESTDACLRLWENPVVQNRGTYASDGFATTMFFKSSATADENWDVFVFGGPVGFRGYYPDYSVNITAAHDVWSWAILKSHPRNTAGKVTLRSADPLDVPQIVFNYFDTGSGDYNADLDALSEAVELARDANERQLLQVEEILPGAGTKSKDDVKEYAKNTAWGHHASCTCPIGADDDPMAVLDSKFQVRGVKGLRVVDASVYPRIPGTFTAVSTYMVGEKAADDILKQFGQTSLTDQGFL